MKILAIAAVALLLAGCATTYERNGLMGGYDDIQLNATTFRVKASGNGYTSPGRVESIMLLRAAEIAEENGYRYFAIIGGDGISTRTTFAGMVGGSSFTTANVSSNIYGNSIYSSGTARTTYNPGVPTYTDRSRGDITIKLLTEREAAGEDAFDASIIAPQLRERLGVEPGA